MKRYILIALLFIDVLCFAVNDKPYVTSKREKDAFPLAEKSTTAALYADAADHAGVLRAFRSFRDDLKMVTGSEAAFATDGKFRHKVIVLAGTIGKNRQIDELVARRKIDVSAIAGKWESFIIQSVPKPFPGVDLALVIAGSDKRGTIFGIYDLSQEIGVSPWFWWADVPVKKQPDLYVLPGSHTKGEPKVQYRGIFINDEQPALGGWVRDNYNGFKHGFYEKVFELILRMKGNFLWPAMWGQSFYTDDPLNPKLADEYGVVISTSHHEPLMRAHVEWQREGGGPWNYMTNEKRLREFWTEGIRRMGENESIVTLAMRGDGDEPMSEESNVQLLQRIVADQRKIIAETTGKPIESVPQVWALYKEVQDYYDKGMRVPDDVILLLCDDNWGNIRKLPNLKERRHPGGYGIYYHYDYVGDPRNYKWLNTNPIPKVWEQMHMAYEYGANKIWIVNVGDIKPMEFPIEFFLDYAWNPEAWPHDRLDDYTKMWAAREFGSQFAAQIARIMALYTKYNGRRKPELLGPDSYSPRLYSLVNFREARRVVEEYNALAKTADSIYQKLPTAYKDAYYQLILYPVQACANINEMYWHVRMNRMYGAQGRPDANKHARAAEKLFNKDAELARYYNETMAGGKWNHMMDQKRIGYVGWHDTFEANKLPDMVSVTPLSNPSMGVVAEGSEKAWPAVPSIVIPEFDSFNDQERFLEIFNRGTGAFSFQLEDESGLLNIKPQKGEVNETTPVSLSVNWSRVPEGVHDVKVRIRSLNKEEALVDVKLRKFSAADISAMKGFIDSNGFISIEAPSFSRKKDSAKRKWVVLPDHGRTGSSIKTLPSTESDHDVASSPFVEYDFSTFNDGKAKAHFYLSPTIDFTGGTGLKFGVGIDAGSPSIVNMHGKNTHRDWQESVKDNIRIVTVDLGSLPKGNHRLRFYALDPGVVLQKVVIDTGNLPDSYLGPPQSRSK